MDIFFNFYYSHPIIFWYLITINLITFFVYGMDKMKSAMGAWRVKEKTLLTLALIGGSIGGIAGIKLFRHKTRKTSFLLPFVVILLLQIGLIYYLFFI